MKLLCLWHKAAPISTEYLLRYSRQTGLLHSYILILLSLVVKVFCRKTDSNLESLIAMLNCSLVLRVSKRNSCSYALEE